MLLGWLVRRVICAHHMRYVVYIAYSSYMRTQAHIHTHDPMNNVCALLSIVTIKFWNNWLQLWRMYFIHFNLANAWRSRSAPSVCNAEKLWVFAHRVYSGLPFACDIILIKLCFNMEISWIFSSMVIYCISRYF